MVCLMASIVRLHVDHPLAEGQTVPVDGGQAHYLFGVMRLGPDAEVRLFNGRDGEWAARVTEAGRKRGGLICIAQSAPQVNPPDLWLLFAPIKKARTDFIVEKATEMGAARICPVLTDYTNAERVRIDRLQAHAIEAAEQCGGTFVPDVAEPQKLSKLLDTWDRGRMILHCDEAIAGSGMTPGLEQFGPGESWAILIGPEGGFSPAERQRLDTGLDGSVLRYSLGPRILRADTAAVAALTLWQAALGDWR